MWGELPCTPSGAQITWRLPVLMQGADAGPGGGCQPAALRLRALSSGSPALSSQDGVYRGRGFLVKSWGLSALVPSHHTEKGPERSRTPAPPHSVLFWTRRPPRRGCDLRGRAPQVDLGASQGPCPDRVTGPGEGQQGKPRGHRVLCVYLFAHQSRALALTTVRADETRSTCGLNLRDTGFKSILSDSPPWMRCQKQTAPLP